MNRRDFMRTGTFAAMAGCRLSQPIEPVVVAPPSADPIRVGVIGCGGRGTGAVVQALRTEQDVKLVAMADAFADQVENSYDTITSLERDEWLGGDADLRARIDVPEERRFAGFDAYEKVLPLVDVVILATPPGFRPIHFEAAVRAGKHVFMEKPVATDAPGIRRVLKAAKAAQEAKLNVIVGLQRHYQTEYLEWVERLHSGMIGDIVLGRVYWNDAGVWVRERQPGQTEMEYQMRNWYYFNWLCGDHIVEQHIHNLDVANWVLGGHPVRAQGQGGRLIRKSREHGEIFDHHFVEFAYADGTRMYSQCRHIKGCPRTSPSTRSERRGRRTSVPRRSPARTRGSTRADG